MLLFYIKWQITKESFNKKIRMWESLWVVLYPTWSQLWRWVVFDEVDSGVAICGGGRDWLLLKPQEVVATRLSSLLPRSSMTTMDTFSPRREAVTPPTTPKDYAFLWRVWPLNGDESTQMMNRKYPQEYVIPSKTHTGKPNIMKQEAKKKIEIKIEQDEVRKGKSFLTQYNSKDLGKFHENKKWWKM